MFTLFLRCQFTLDVSDLYKIIAYCVKEQPLRNTRFVRKICAMRVNFNIVIPNPAG